jgi:hypothetical protein
MVVGVDRIEQFQAAFRGEVIQRGDSGYEMARKIWNASIDKHPSIIARCSGVADVVEAVNYWKSTFLREFSDDAMAVLVEHANRPTSPLSGVVIEYYGGAASRVGVSETAFAHRQAQYQVNILAQWVDPAESPRHIQWARDLADAMRSFSSGGYLLNFLGEEGEDTIKAAFGSNYNRLMAVKKKYDSKNFFCLNQNIKPEV